MKISAFMKAYKYAQDVASGQIVAGKYVIKQCKHFLEMIENKDSIYYKKYFVDMNVVKKIDSIVKLSNFATGEYAGKSCYEHIAGFQWFILINLYSVFHRDKPFKRRYEKACVFIARKNSKTWLVSMFMLLALLFEPDYAQLVAGANTREQARILFDEIKKTLEVSPLLLKHFTIQRDKIICKMNDNVLFPIAGEARNTDGKLVAVGCVDEYGSARDSSIYDSLQTSMLSTINRLLFTISTGYPYEINPMRDQIDYGKKVLDGVIEDDRFFLMCYELDEGDDWTNENTWIKSNPLQATSELGMEFLRGECKMALEMASKQSSFRTKNLNQWLHSAGEDKYLDFELWKKCGVDKIDFKGKEVVVGIDASLTTDLTAISMIYKEDRKYYVKAIGILPSESLKTRNEKFDYRLSEELGECHITEGYIVDYNYLEQLIRDIPKRYGCQIKEIAVDPYNITNLATKLAEDFDVVFVKQNYFNLSSPTKEFRNEVYNGNIVYEKSKLFDWNISNCSTVKDKSENEMITKKNKNNMRIDLVASTIFAFKQAYSIEEIKKFNIDDVFII